MTTLAHGPTYFGDFKDRGDLIRQYAGLYSTDERPVEAENTEWVSSDAGRWRDFDKLSAELENATILLAWYGPGSYSGHAFVLYEKSGELFTTTASHCSCNGLEGSFFPTTKVTWKALAGFIAKRTSDVPDTTPTPKVGDHDYDTHEYYDGEWEAGDALLALVKQNAPELYPQTNDLVLNSDGELTPYASDGTLWSESTDN